MLISDSEVFKPFSLVVIGKNEAENLPGTFQSIKEMNYPPEKVELIYVDTGSDDGSIDIARKFTGKVFLENSKWPTAGLARNRGLLEASHDIIHFLDGDIAIAPEYFRVILPLMAEKDVEGIYGYLEEKSETGVNKLMLTHWKDKKEGYSNATGGGGTYLREALLKINGYDERVFKGQESELGVRFREAGFKIWFAKVKMGTHNYGISTLNSLMKFHFRHGKSLAYNSMLNVENDFFASNNKMNLRNIIINIFLYAILIAIILSGKLLLIPAFLFTYVLLLLTKIILYNKVKSVQKIRYFFMMELFRFVVFWGQMQIYFLALTNFLFSRQAFISPKMFLEKT